MDESHCFYMGHLFTSITFGLERWEPGRLVNLSVVFLFGGFRSSRVSRARSTDIDSTLRESTVKDRLTSIRVTAWRGTLQFLIGVNQRLVQKEKFRRNSLMSTNPIIVIHCDVLLALL